MKQKLLFCRHCGNITAMIRDTGVPVYCCKEEMQELIPGQKEGAGEKHIPVVKRCGNSIHVQVGAVQHPMTSDHYIEWVCMETEKTIQYAHLCPEDLPVAEFSVLDGDRVCAVYAFCNQHSLWRK